MKLLIPLFAILISFPLSAQESPTPVQPDPAPAPVPASKTAQAKAPLPTTPASNAKARPPGASSGGSRSSGRRVVLPPSSRSAPRVSSTRQPAPSSTRSKVASGRTAPPAGVATSTRPAGIQENITIQLKGLTDTGEHLDASLTGIGPIFQADLAIGKDATILSHTYSVESRGTGYLVEFSVGMRVRMVSSTSGPHTNYEFRENAISGKVLVKPGKPVTIANHQGRAFTLTISKP